MSHTGIRLRLNVPGAGVILEGDSDWLHLNALMAEGPPEISMAQLAQDYAAPEPRWHQAGVVMGHVEIWVQPVMLPDSYPDDGLEEETDPERCDCPCSNCSGCLGA